MTFFMAGGGTGGHVIPAIAVARELAARGHRPMFIGTRAGFEGRLVPPSGFPIEFIEIGGLKRVGLAQTARTLGQLPRSFFRVLELFRREKPGAVFSMGGYVAGPVVLAAIWRRVPLIVMEPNAMPGLTNRQIGRFVARALLSFEEAARFFPKGRTEITGLPVRREFFEVGTKARGEKFTILVTGGSRGSRTLNEAMRGAWGLFAAEGLAVRIVHQAGRDAHEALAAEFAKTGLEGEVVPFISDMPGAFAEADLIVCRSGAGAVAELAAAGKAAILVPFPFAADQHQLKNAQAFERAGAAVLVLDREMDGARLFAEVKALAGDAGRLAAMGERARTFARAGAARRAAELLIEVS